MVIAAIAAGAAALSAGAGIANSISAGSASAKALAQQKQLADAQLAQSGDNEAYQRAVSALINRRSVAGSSDSFGSSLRYDPTTNQWVSQLGPLPQAAQTAADQAGIRQNTTVSRQAELANEQAALRATRAGPAADAAQRDLGSFRPMGQDQLIGLLQNRATTASNETYRPLVADTLRAFARSGTAAGPVLGQLGREQSDTLRKSLIDSQIAGMTGVDQINQSKRSGLAQNAAATSALASPSFQQVGVAPNDAGKTMASLLAARSASAATAPAFGQSGVNTAAGLSQKAFDSASTQAGRLPVDTGAAIGKEIGALGKNTDIQSALRSLFGSSTNADDPFKAVIQNRGLSATGAQSTGFGTDKLYGTGGIF